MKKFLHNLSLVHFLWFIRIKWRLLFTKKIKVGFGPITTGEDDFAERKWRIDPIIREINARSDIYRAGFFFSHKEMKQFDRIIIVKKFTRDCIEKIKQLKNKRFIYDIVDNPNCEKKYEYYLNHPEFLKLMDGFILSSPLQKKALKPYQKLSSLIEHPIINSSLKENYEDKNEIQILAQGYFENLKNLEKIEILLPEISREIGKKIILTYHSEVVLPQTEWTRYVKWTTGNCFELMNSSDIAITIKDLHKLHQRTKPSTKVVAYMAAGLPVICYPTVADRLVINHRINGFFAYSQSDWKRWIKTLALSARLRKQIGRAARVSVKERYSIAQITDKYLALLDLI